MNYNSENPTLVNSVVCFIDILGFSSLGMEAIKNEKGNDYLRKLHFSLTNAREAINPYPTNAKVKVFTDNVVIGWPILQEGEGELGSTFLNLSEYQLKLSIDGFLYEVV